MKIARPSYIVGGLILFFAIVAGVSIGRQAPPASGTPHTITIKDFQFSPRDLEIPSGSKVTWINKDEEPHKVAEVNNTFVSQPLDTDQTFSFEFKSAGTYRYFCTLHPHMTGSIIVQSK